MKGTDREPVLISIEQIIIQFAMTHAKMEEHTKHTYIKSKEPDFSQQKYSMR